MKKFFTFNNIIFSCIFFAAILGIFASLVLSIEKIELLKNANYSPSCSFNAVFNCVSVTKSPQAELFGFPNQFMGLIGYGIVAAIAFILLYKFIDLGKKFHYFFFLGSIIAFIFSYWLLYQSYFEIQALCLYCLISCFAATTIFFSSLVFNLKEGYFGAKLKHFFITKKYILSILILWYVAYAALIIWKVIS